jgi:hypothetical protein
MQAVILGVMARNMTFMRILRKERMHRFHVTRKLRRAFVNSSENSLDSNDFSDSRHVCSLGGAMVFFQGG